MNVSTLLDAFRILGLQGIDLVGKFGWVFHRPTSPGDTSSSSSWASNKGPLRPKSEDVALAFELAGHQVVLVADGVSGEPFGAAAAHLAVQSASWSIVRQFGASRWWRTPEPGPTALLALQTASGTLNREGVSQ